MNDKVVFQSLISHFIGSLKKITDTDEQNKSLLILNGYNSHVTVEVVPLAIKCSLNIITLPTYTFRALQTINVLSFKPF